jgi:hypothetical protein
MEKSGTASLENPLEESLCLLEVLGRSLQN